MNAWHLHPQLADDSTPVIELALCEDAVEIIDLSPAQRTQLTAEIDTAARALKALFKPDKLNVAALGNLVPQLHVHVIARYHTDIAWPRPVWGAANACPYAPEQLVDRVRQLRTQLAR